MDDNKPAAAREKPAKPAKAKPQKAKESAPKRRERHIDAKDVFVPGADSGEASMNDLFRMRLAYLMNGHDALGRHRLRHRPLLRNDAGLPARLRRAGH